MHINQESDYAVRLVHCLAQSAQLPCRQGDASRLDAQTLAGRAQVPERFALKILRKLVAAGVVRSFKGKRGGYCLGRAPGEITLRQVIEAVEGPYRFSRCVEEGYDCHYSRGKPEADACWIEGAACASCHDRLPCPYHEVFDDITQMVTARLDAVTFAVPACPPLSREEN